MNYSFQNPNISLSQIAEQVEISFANLKNPSVPYFSQDTPMADHFEKKAPELPFKTTEEMQIEKIAKEKKAVKKFLQKSKNYYKKIKQKQVKENNEQLSEIKKKISYV